MTNVPVLANDVTQATAVAVGNLHSCAIISGGTIQCWGGNPNGQLGNGTTNDSAVPVTVPGITDAIALAAGNWHSCAILNGGTLRCWGANTFGALGNGSLLDSPVPVEVNGITSATAGAFRLPDFLQSFFRFSSGLFQHEASRDHVVEGLPLLGKTRHDIADEKRDESGDDL